tara:strand:- start:470 stop:1168 length:699 start_codon:yes stop_codon:yes gene_type:complete
MRKIKKYHIIPLLIVSLIGTVLPAIIFAKSQMHIQSSLAGMLNSLTPIFTLIFGIIIFNKNLNVQNIIGIMIGLAGTYLLLSPLKDNILYTKYSLLIIFATICYAISINTIKEKLNSLKSLEIAVISSMLSSIVPFIYICHTGMLYNIEKIYVNFSHFYYLIILGGICTSLAIILFNYLIKSSSALFGSSTTYLIPIFAIIWGLLDAEFINNEELIGIGIILVGVFIMNKKN